MKKVLFILALFAYIMQAYPSNRIAKRYNYSINVTSFKTGNFILRYKEYKKKVFFPQQRKKKYYRNIYRQRIQSPTRYNNAPQGATAECWDGTYSFSRNRRGTCSHHGGVKRWF